MDFVEVECGVFPVVDYVEEIDNWGSTKNMLLGNIYMMMSRQSKSFGVEK